MEGLDALVGHAERRFVRSADISEGVDARFEKIRLEINQRFAAGTDTDRIRPGLEIDVPRLIHAGVGDLLDDLINSLMQDARSILVSAPDELKNSFYDADFREKVRQVFRFDPPTIALSPDWIPNVKSAGKWAFPAIGAIPAGVSLLGLAPSLLTPQGTLIRVALILAGMGAGLYCHLTLNKSRSASREQLHKEIVAYVDAAKEPVRRCLLVDGRRGFIIEFCKFCKDHGFSF